MSVTYAQSETAGQAEVEDLISTTIGQVWLDSQALQTFVGLATLTSVSGEYDVKGVTREDALLRARATAANLKSGLRDLALLKPVANVEQRRAIDGLELIAYTRVRAIDALLAIEGGGGVDALVTSCVGWWDCWGFRTACVAAGGKWENWGAGTETCTT